MTEPVMPYGPTEGAHTEVWVVGQPNPMVIGGGDPVEFPPYRFRWDGPIPRDARDGRHPMDAARDFVRSIIEHGGGTSPWLDGPRIVTRTATYGPWIEHPL